MLSLAHLKKGGRTVIYSPDRVVNTKYHTFLSSAKNKSVFLSEHSFHLEGDKYEMWVIYVSADIPTDYKFPLTEFS